MAICSGRNLTESLLLQLLLQCLYNSHVTVDAEIAAICDAKLAAVRNNSGVSCCLCSSGVSASTTGVCKSMIHGDEALRNKRREIDYRVGMMNKIKLYSGE